MQKIRFLRAAPPSIGRYEAYKVYSEPQIFSFVTLYMDYIITTTL